MSLIMMNTKIIIIVDDVISFVSSQKSKEKLKSSSSSNSNEYDNESKELDYNEDEDQLEEKQEEIREISTITTNKVF